MSAFVEFLFGLGPITFLMNRDICDVCCSNLLAQGNSI
jgi:hypothetical protein